MAAKQKNPIKNKIGFRIDEEYRRSIPYERLHTLDWIGILYVGIGTSIIGYLFWYYALCRIDATRLAVFANGQPIVISILSVIFLGATITPQFIIGGIVTLAGVIITQRK